MAATPRRRLRRVAIAGAIVALAGASVAAVNLRNEPAGADYLTAKDATRAVTRATVLGGSSQLVGLTLTHSEAMVRIQRGDEVQTWAVRPGKEATKSSTVPASAEHLPVPAEQIDLTSLLQKVAADPVAASCKPAALKAELATSHVPSPVTHIWCLDGARHAWRDARGEALADVDPRTTAGLSTALADLRAATGTQKASYVAIRFGGDDAGIDLEKPGPCRDLAGCDAVVASRRVHVDNREPALATRTAPARLNYAELMDLGSLDPERLHAAIERQTKVRKGVDWWRDLTVTVSQKPGQAPTLGFVQGSRVFWTDMDGNEAHF